MEEYKPFTELETKLLIFNKMRYEGMTFDEAFDYVGAVEAEIVRVHTRNYYK